MAPQPAVKPLLLAKTLLTRTTSAVFEQRRPLTTPLIPAPPTPFSPLCRFPNPQPHPLHSRPGSHGTWPFPAPARVHTDPSAFGRHYTTFSNAHHPNNRLHQKRPVVVAVPGLVRFALGAREFVGGRLAPEIRRLGMGLSMGCGTPFCRHVRTIFSEKGGFDYW
ncbi:hypothetical protein Q9L58_001163 [Maublancomyces gigas]|uniref:Uncharacterized protein n=1 Tax=Discina gigas TaxID=1032678 RepID=A0ABR3GV72_9PEZI